MHKLSVFLTVLLLGCSQLGAMTLQEAKDQNKICELPSGYVHANDPSADDLAKSVNAQRQQEYANIAQKNHISVEEAARIAAEKLTRHACNS